ncbi:unnamed protein product [Linum tenue]|uniref:Uncharacterized protein n=1 Tax=Linum tenue TaxID=586396 RepID=A0AAV0P009_9ROSI|nr:unnamed protein product [Linum tenue]
MIEDGGYTALRIDDDGMRGAMIKRVFQEIASPLLLLRSPTVDEAGLDEEVAIVELEDSVQGLLEARRSVEASTRLERLAEHILVSRHDQEVVQSSLVSKGMQTSLISGFSWESIGTRSPYFP